MQHLRVHGKGGKLRYLPLHPGTAELIADYLEAARHGEDLAAALFRPVKNNNPGGTMEGAITADGIYRMVKHYATRAGVNIEGFGAHSLRATAATNALDHEADIAKVQEWLGHANIATTRLYDRRKTRPGGTPTSPPLGSTTGGRQKQTPRVTGRRRRYMGFCHNTTYS